MVKIKFLLIILLIATFFIGFSQEFYKHNVEYAQTSSLHGSYKVLEIHTRTKSQIRKNTNMGIRNEKKRCKKKKISWVAKKPGKAIETYIIKVSDSTNYPYFIASAKVKTNSEEKIVIGNTYVMELTMISYMGEVHGPHFPNIGMTNGTSILLPREAWAGDIYISPNLQGLYYLK
jgi:hypothetical protein